MIASQVPAGIRMGSLRQRETDNGWKHGSCREKKYAGAFRTTHRIVSHRRGPWSGLRATATCPSAQRARIRIRNCSQRLNQSVAGLLFLFWPSGPAASRNSIAIAGLSEGVHFLLWVHCATNHVVHGLGGSRWWWSKAVKGSRWLRLTPLCHH